MSFSVKLSIFNMYIIPNFHLEVKYYFSNLTKIYQIFNLANEN